MYDIIVYIGRFQPFHEVHLETVRRASKMCRHVAIIIGSAYQPSTYKNPWSAQERHIMIAKSLEQENISNYSVHYNPDSVYNTPAWLERVQEHVKQLGGANKIGIIGYKKDDSSSYLDMFPQWDLIEMEEVQQLDATQIRELYFSERYNPNFISGVLPGPVKTYLRDYWGTKEYINIVKERYDNEEYKAQFSGLPYPPIFVTADPVVFCAGHVLLVERGKRPGKGLMALPGGFVNSSDASIEDAMLRELKEETNIKVPVPVLRGSIKGSKVFDHKDRSARGRTITHAYNIVLADKTLPKIRAADDAALAMWVPFNDVESEWMFEDHYDIIQHFLGR